MLIALVICLSLALLFYKYYLRPKSIYQHYQRIIKGLGYRVLALPFNPLSAPLFQLYHQNQGQRNDPLYSSKHIFKDYDIIVTNLLNYPFLVFTNLNIAKQMMTIDKIYTVQKIGFALKIMKHSAGEGLVLIEGDKWKERRKILSKAFTFDFIKDKVPLVSKVCDQVFEKLDELSLNKETGEIRSQLFKIGSKIFSLVTLAGFIGLDSTEQKIEGKQFHQCALEVVQLSFQNSRDPFILFLGLWFYKLGLRSKYRHLQRLLRQIKGLARVKLQKIRQQFSLLSEQDKKKSNNIVHLMLYHSSQQGFQLTDQQIVDEIFTFLIAGTETTLNLFTMMILYIFQHKEIEMKVRQQLETILKTQEDFNYDNIKKLELLDWIQLETIRMGGPNEALLDRIALQDVMIGDIPVKQGTALNYILRPTFFNPEIFEEPFKFNPERWASQNQQQVNLILMSFGAGPRSCIGKNLAFLDTKIAVIKFLQRYQDLKEEQERTFQYGFSYHAKSSAVSFRKIK